MDKPDVPAGTLTLMVLRTVETLGPLHGYGIARRIEQASGDQLELNQGTIYPALLQLEQRGWIKGSWASRTTIAAPGFTQSPPRDGSGLPPKSNGGASRRR